jgi:hypothetical protein
MRAVCLSVHLAGASARLLVGMSNADPIPPSVYLSVCLSTRPSSWRCQSRSSVSLYLPSLGRPTAA